MLGAFMRVAIAATFLGAFGGAVVDLRWAGDGLAALLVSGLVGMVAMRGARVRADAADSEMPAMMAGMAGGGLGGVCGVAAATAGAALLGLAHPHTIDWSMLLMGGGMGGMLGPTIGGALPVRARAPRRRGPWMVILRSRRGA